MIHLRRRNTAKWSRSVELWPCSPSFVTRSPPPYVAASLP
jgi:hypothetical protein